MCEGAEALVVVRRNKPTTLPDSIGKFCFIPFDGTERLVEGANLFDARPSNDPWADDDVDFSELEPVNGPSPMLGSMCSGR